MGAFVVESPALQHGVRVGTMRVYVATEERAASLAAEVSDRTYRFVPLDELPEHVRERLSPKPRTVGDL